MKLRRLLVLALVLVMLFTMTGCNNINFMKSSAVNKLVDEYGTPTMDVTLEYTLNEGKDNEKTVELVLGYELNLASTPITVVNFINLVEDGFYNEVKADKDTTSYVFNTRDSAANAWYVGSYKVTTTTALDEDGDEIDAYYTKGTALDYTIKGEFVQNGWVIPVGKANTDEEVTDNNARFELFSLAMYHGKANTTFDNASSQFFLTTNSLTTENYVNYAVFAYLKTMQVNINGVEGKVFEGVTAEVFEEINEELITTSSKKVVSTDENGDKTESSVTMLKNIFRIVSIKMTDGNDYSNLPTNYIINNK